MTTIASNEQTGEKESVTEVRICHLTVCKKSFIAYPCRENIQPFDIGDIERYQKTR